MTTELQLEVADSLDASPELLPYLSELLADLPELGSSADEIVEMIRPLGLAQGSRALDLGCGKGVTAIALAERLGFQVLGVDGFAPFVKAAGQEAVARGVAERCEFRCGDLRDAIAEAKDFDLVLMIGVGQVLGGTEQTVGALRATVCRGGLILIDDAFLADGVEAPPAGYEDYASYGETIRRLTMYGDKLVAEQISTRIEMEEMNSANTEAIRRRAENLIERYPEAADLLRGYVATQEQESRVLEEQVVGAAWILRRV